MSCEQGQCRSLRSGPFNASTPRQAIAVRFPAVLRRSSKTGYGWQASTWAKTAIFEPAKQVVYVMIPNEGTLSATVSRARSRRADFILTCQCARMYFYINAAYVGADQPKFQLESPFHGFDGGAPGTSKQGRYDHPFWVGSRLLGMATLDIGGAHKIEPARTHAVQWCRSYCVQIYPWGPIFQ